MQVILTLPDILMYLFLSSTLKALVSSLSYRQLLELEVKVLFLRAKPKTFTIKYLST